MTLLTRLPRSWGSAVVFALGVVVGGGLMAHAPASVPERQQAPAASVSLDGCSGGSDVSQFVCRNSWMAQSRYSYR